MPRMHNVESSDEEEEENQSQSQSQKNTQLSQHPKTKLAGLVCNYLLVAETKKIPVRRAEIVKATMKDHGRHFTSVMEEASNILEKVYAYKVVELEKNSYILINNIGTVHSDSEHASKKSDDSRTGLLTFILTGIFMTGEMMQEGSMREYLRKLGIDLTSRDAHPVYGNVSKLINQDFVKQRYLAITQDTTTDPPSREYRWGERAQHELSKRDLLELVCKIYGQNMRPEIWTSQWRTIQREEEELSDTVHGHS
ncbi:hypothetical protein OTU49_003587 [Cherax quadricarinatus]|uniref:MAGE domain-containing protein n=1 Tax=Cherax quadricarinatus TaxID=27406 RepID=A0AAW0XH90_CHEQU